MSSNHHDSIIIKRPKKVKGGHHGGNWKVAYADFMTALMAFFLLLWILSGSNEEQLRGLADYFTPSKIPLVEISGIGTEIEARKAPVTEIDPDAHSVPQGPAEVGQETADISETRTGAVNPWVKLDEQTTREPDPSSAAGTLSAQLDSVGEEISKALAATPALQELAENVMVTRTEKGVIIEVMDLGEHAMFEVGSADVSNDLRAILTEISPIFADMPVDVSVTGHTDARAYRGGADYGNWELSADRANATRRAMLEAGILPVRFTRVAGVAAVDLLVPEDPEDARNRRVTIELIAEQG